VAERTRELDVSQSFSDHGSVRERHTNGKNTIFEFRLLHSSTGRKSHDSVHTRRTLSETDRESTHPLTPIIHTSLGLHPLTPIIHRYSQHKLSGGVSAAAVASQLNGHHVIVQATALAPVTVIALVRVTVTRLTTRERALCSGLVCSWSCGCGCCQRTIIRAAAHWG